MSAFLTSEITQLEKMIASDPKLQMELWSQSVRADARDKNPLKDFMGGEGSGLPIIEKSDPSKNGGQTVVFSTRAPVLGRGVMNNQRLTDHTQTMEYGTFSVTVDFRRFALSEEQLVQYFSLPGNAEKNRTEVMQEICRGWWTRTQCDDSQIVLRNKALFSADQANVLFLNNVASIDELTLADMFSTGSIDDGASMLLGQGGAPIAVDHDEAGSEIPEYLVFGPRAALGGLKSDPKWIAAVNATQRGKDVTWFNGKLPRWENCVVHRHNTMVDSGPNRQGSPLLPIAFVGVPIASAATTTITGGGKWNTAGTRTDPLLFDFFSYFGGFGWKTYDKELLPVDNNTYYAIIFNVSGADRGKYEIVKWTATGNDGNKLTVTRECDDAGVQQKTKLIAAGRYTNVHPTGSLIIPCNKLGVPIGHVLAMGQEALMIGKGALEADPIEGGEDFKSKTTGKWHIQSEGIQSIIGYAPYQDTAKRYSNYALIACAVDYPQYRLVDLTA